MGALLACRSDSLPFWRLLLVPNPLLWLELLSEPLLAGGCLILMLLADTAHRAGLRGFGNCQI